MPAPKFPAPSPPVWGDGIPNVFIEGDNSEYDHVVIHSAVMACVPGGAAALGRMNQTSTTGSWHYSVDPETIYQCSYDRFICWGAPPNPRKIHIEMADYPAPWPAASHSKKWWINFKRSWRWAAPNHRKMLRLTAKLTAELLLHRGLPVQYCTAAELRAGEKGWTTHAQVTNAFHQSVHWDPGVWPRRHFAKLVHQYAAEMRAEARRK